MANNHMKEENGSTYISASITSSILLTVLSKLFIPPLDYKLWEGRNCTCTMHYVISSVQNSQLALSRHLINTGQINKWLTMISVLGSICPYVHNAYKFS